MKKSYLLLPLVAAMSLVGCTSNSGTAEVTDATTGSAVSTPMPSWQSSDTIQSVEMPASMSSAPTQTIRQAQTAYQNVQTQAQSTYQNAQTSYANHTTGQSETVGNCQVVRDSAGVPVYAQMVKGCYTDSSYTVGKSDTIYLISFLTGKTPAQIASLNSMSVNSKLSVGQVLRVQ